MHFKVVIVCPQTKVEVPTGVVVNIKTFKELPTAASHFRCGACGEEHAWSVADAQLASLSPSESAAFIPPNDEKN